MPPKREAEMSGKASKIAASKIHVTTLGCSKNVYDSEILMGQLKAARADLVKEPEEADAIIINTCGFIVPAKEESIQAILEAERLKQSDPGKKIVVCGCLSARYPAELKQQLQFVDAFFGTEEFGNILSFLNLKQARAPEHLYETRLLSTPSHYAYLKIAEGCNHKCAFCAIPLMRGRHRSRPVSQIVDEARLLAQQGVKELILVSQDTSFYGLDLYQEQKLVELLAQLEKIDGLGWIRLHYLYPTTVTDQLIEFIAQGSKVVPYLDMPVQHITDRMLQIMKRGGNGKRIYQIIENARKKIKDVTIRTTLIVGHPGETEKDFRALKDFVRQTEFDRLGVFKYSREEQTSAYQLEDLPEKIKMRRYEEIMKIQQHISIRKNRGKVGTVQRVLIDEVSLQEKIALGRTVADSPEIDNEVVVMNYDRKSGEGEFETVAITDSDAYELFGEVVGE